MRMHQLGPENCDGGEVVGAVSATKGELGGEFGSFRVGELTN